MPALSQAVPADGTRLVERRTQRRQDGHTAANIPILLLENIADTAITTFTAAGFKELSRDTAALQGDALNAALKKARILGIRSGTNLNADILDQADDLLAVGCFSVGTNQVDLTTARNRGIPVFNAPFSNTRSVAELTLAEIIMLLRGIFPKSTAAHQGTWLKTAQNAFEARGKILGIVGYGNIGSQLAVLAEGLGLKVIYYDHTDKLRHGNVHATDNLEQLLSTVDFVSLHLPDTPQTRGIIGKREIDLMKPGAYLINNARGSLVDLPALADAINAGRLGGAALDVFPEEPSAKGKDFKNVMQGIENVILTPHIAGSTEEAQSRIGAEVAKKLVEYLQNGSTVGAVNFPQLLLSASSSSFRFIQVQRNAPGELRKLNALLEAQGLNITTQYFETSGDIGYVAVDVDGDIPDADQLLASIRNLSGTIRVRLIDSNAPKQVA